MKAEINRENEIGSNDSINGYREVRETYKQQGLSNLSESITKRDFE